MKKTLAILVLLAAQSRALVLEADAPAKLANGSNIPADHLPDLRGTLYSKPSGGSTWVAVGTTTNSTFRWTAADPAAGTWQFRATAQFLDNTNTVSDVSDTLTYKVYGIPGKPINLRLYIVAGLAWLAGLLGLRKLRRA